MGQLLGHESQEKDIDFKQSPYYPLLFEFEFEDQNEDLQRISDIRYSREDFKSWKNKYHFDRQIKDTRSHLKLNIHSQKSSLISSNIETADQHEHTFRDSNISYLIDCSPEIHKLKLQDNFHFNTKDTARIDIVSCR